jgi:glyceraldehyde 3-phosphate dehydrogenase
LVRHLPLPHILKLQQLGELSKQYYTTMDLPIGINGFGRIGRILLRLSIARKDVEVVAINEPFSSLDEMVYLMNYDTVHGKLPITFVKDINNNLCYQLDGQTHKIVVFRERNPIDIPWTQVGAKVICESSGVFLTTEKASSHLGGCVERVVISAPPKDDTPIYVRGANLDSYTKSDKVISNASCTTNCLAPLIRIVDQNFGVESALMTTVHAMTASQAVVDRGGGRSGRSATQNIIPASTGAAKAVGKVLPNLRGKITGMAFRVPVLDVSVVDVTIQFSKETSYDEVMETIHQASESEGAGIIRLERQPVVSSDLIGDTHSCIVDVGAGIQLNPKFMKLVAWYDNEVGYSSRLLDVVVEISS